jgi:predicted nucleotidyltransferase
MSTSHPTFTARPDKVPTWVIQVIRTIQHHAIQLGMEFVLVGAIARDIVLEGVFGLGARRQTIDLDFGFLVESWEQFAALKSALVATGYFQPVDRESQRLLYQGKLRVDLIPFGGIEENGKIAWPPSREIVLNVAGFKEALASALRVEVDVGLVVPVVSLPGLAVLKLFAWADQRDKANDDAADLRRLLKDYGNAGNEVRLYGAEWKLLEDANFDPVLAGARLLGKDVAIIVTKEIADKIAGILESEEQFERLLIQMLRTTAVVDEQIPAKYAELLDAFRKGFLKG